MSENPESLRIAGAAYFDEFTKTHDLLSALEAQARRIAALEAGVKSIIDDLNSLCEAKDARIAELEAALDKCADFVEHYSFPYTNIVERTQFETLLKQVASDLRAARAAYRGEKE